MARGNKAGQIIGTMFVGAIALAFLTALIPSVANNITGAETSLVDFPGTYAMLGLTVLVLVGSFLWSMLRGSGMVNAIALPAAAPVGRVGCER